MQKIPDFEECMLTSAFQIAHLPPKSATVSISDTPTPLKMVTCFLEGPLVKVLWILISYVLQAYSCFDAYKCFIRSAHHRSLVFGVLKYCSS